jgi:hypothetical protein
MTFATDDVLGAAALNIIVLDPFNLFLCDIRMKITLPALQQSHLVVTKSTLRPPGRRPRYCKKATLGFFRLKAAIFALGPIAKNRACL